MLHSPYAPGISQLLGRPRCDIAGEDLRSILHLQLGHCVVWHVLVLVVLHQVAGQIEGGRAQVNQHLEVVWGPYPLQLHTPSPDFACAPHWTCCMPATSQTLCC